MFRKTDAEMRVRHRLMTHPQENSCICLHMQLIAILSRTGVKKWTKLLIKQNDTLRVRLYYKREEL